MAEMFELAIAVVADDIDENGHVNNVTYVRWIQDVAVAHWRALASVEAQAELYWVVLRHEVDYKAPTFAGDQVIAKTWVGSATRVRFERHTEIMRVSDGVVLAKARTLWCPMDVSTGRPAAVSTDIRALFSVVQQRH